MNQLLMNQLMVMLSVILFLAVFVKSRSGKSDKRWMPDIRRVA
jgi:hypothetical protein